MLINLMRMQSSKTNTLVSLKEKKVRKEQGWKRNLSIKRD